VHFIFAYCTVFNERINDDDDDDNDDENTNRVIIPGILGRIRHGKLHLIIAL